MTNYVFGYGSLLERASRTLTNPEAVGAWPARVTGYQRGWFHQFADNVGSTCTYLGELRSEEHTSELQSLTNLVCRLLLEKKKRTRDAVLTRAHTLQLY